MIEVGYALDFLTSQSTEALMRLFWFTLSLEIPRYVCGVLALSFAALAERRVGHPPPAVRPTVSITVVGHNEADSLERCLRSLREQTLPPTQVVVVSDGSSDGMAALATEMVRQGLATHALATDLRNGKAAGFNLALHKCCGDVVINVDCDCSYDRFAIESIVASFTDPDVGAVSGDIVPRNGTMSLIARVQEIEYLLSISVGRRVAAGMNQVSCISGAFAAYRRVALEQVGGCDAGGGEDFDLTLRLRGAGWRVAFAPDAVCYTDVPVRLWILVRQRLRWERDALRLRLRKHRRSLMGSARLRTLTEAMHQWDFLIFELGMTAVFPSYLAWLVSQYGGLALPILVAMQFGLLLLDVALLSLAALIVRRSVSPSLLFYMPGYSVYSGWVMRPVRLFAYLQEWFLFGSRHDNYVPAKVRLILKW